MNVQIGYADFVNICQGTGTLKKDTKTTTITNAKTTTKFVEGPEEDPVPLRQVTNWTGTWGPEDDCIGLRLAKDGVYVAIPPAQIPIFADEIAFFARHPTNDLTKPVLAFPCSVDEFKRFFSWAGLKCYDPKDLERFIQKWLKEHQSDEDFVKQLKTDGKSPEEITAYLIQRDPTIIAYRIGSLLPAKPDYDIDSDSARRRGSRLKSKVKKDKRLSQIAGFE